MKSIYYQIKFYFNFELLFWIFGLCYLAFSDFSGNHFTICPIKNLGFDWCPGCGFGMSIHNIFHLEFGNALHSHILGFFGLIVITFRIFTLIKHLFNRESIKDSLSTY